MRGDAHDLPLLEALERGLNTRAVGIDRFFYDWANGRRHGPSPADAAYAQHFSGLSAALEGYAPARGDHAYWSDQTPCSMHIDEVETIWAAIDKDDDWSPFHAKIEAIRRMGEAHRA
jgi:hypothetical protein